MDSYGLIFIVLCVILVTGILSVLPVLSFVLYTTIRRRWPKYKSIGIAVFVLTTLGMIALGIKIVISPSGFGPEYKSVEIKQNIGGTLLCNSEYNADIHSWQYDVDYKYALKNGDTITLGRGSYYGREWKADEQLIRWNNWLILKTGNCHGSDRLILRNLITDLILTYNLDNRLIEDDSLWKAQKIESFQDYCCPESFIQNIQGNEVTVTYKYRTNPTLTKLYGRKTLKYQIDDNSGQIELTTIE
jgi:hypothetical protein